MVDNHKPQGACQTKLQVQATIPGLGTPDIDNEGGCQSTTLGGSNEECQVADILLDLIQTGVNANALGGCGRSSANG